MDQERQQSTRILLETARWFHQEQNNKITERLNQLKAAVKALDAAIDKAYDGLNAVFLNRLFELNGIPADVNGPGDHPEDEALQVVDRYVFGDVGDIDSCMKLLDVELERVRRRLEG